jgi:CDP-diacylglycerol--serine O-phosphatidyltransferase
MKKLFLGVYNPSIILTYISVFSALFGIGQMIAGNSSSIERTMPIAMILLIVSGVCDMFDGTIARKCKRTEIEKDFGVQLDSLADTVAFVVYPVTILIFFTGLKFSTIIIACCYVFAGIMRLGWFNVTTEENGGVFYGLPVTFSSLLFPLIYVICTALKLSTSLTSIVLQISFAIVALLFIANFKLQKPKTTFKIIMAIFAIAAIASLIVFAILV